MIPWLQQGILYDFANPVRWLWHWEKKDGCVLPEMMVIKSWSQMVRGFADDRSMWFFQTGLKTSFILLQGFLGYRLCCDDIIFTAQQFWKVACQEWPNPGRWLTENGQPGRWLTEDDQIRLELGRPQNINYAIWPHRQVNLLNFNIGFNETSSLKSCSRDDSSGLL
jgi:hypothetical protein